MRIVEVRKATAQDASGIAFVHVRSWQVAYRGHMPDEFLDGLDVEKRTNMWRELTQDPGKIIFVAEDWESNIVGFSALGPSRDADANPNTAEVAAIYVHPENGKKESVAHCCPRRWTKFESASLTKLRCGYWRETNEHARFTNRSDLSKTAP
jgi:hypothetical protein